MSTGIELRDEGTEAVIAADVAAHRNAGTYIRNTIEEFARSRKNFTADDVRTALEGNSKVAEALKMKPNLLPAHIGSMAHAGIITAVGMYRPQRASRRASRNLVWRGV